MRFANAIVRTPCPSMINGITNATLGPPNYEVALEQHKKYIEALKQCRVFVTTLKPADEFPDSVFVEDAALLTLHCAIITNPGAPSRNPEPGLLKSTIRKFFTSLEHIEASGTLDGGDVMMVGKHFFIGLSERTNEEGARQLIKILKKYEMTSSIIPLKEMLHLKTGLSYLENNNLLIYGEFLNKEEFSSFNQIVVDEDEAYAANSIWVNDTVIVPMGFPKTLKKIQDVGYRTLTVDVSEFQKLDGGLSCLSLRF
jgi:dimethylargininase